MVWCTMEEEISFETKEEALKHLKENYRNVDSPILFQSISYLKKFYKILTKSEIENVLSTFESYSLMKPLSYRKKSNPFLAFHIRDTFQADLVHINELSEHNNDVKYLFCCTDIFSKRWASYAGCSTLLSEYTSSQVVGGTHIVSNSRSNF